VVEVGWLVSRIRACERDDIAVRGLCARAQSSTIESKIFSFRDGTGKRAHDVLVPNGFVNGGELVTFTFTSSHLRRRAPPATNHRTTS
jgi:hypothetical protein